jgi:hypothetical protein
MNDKPHIEIHRSDNIDEWPEAISRRFIWLADLAHDKDFSLLCGVGLHHERKRLSVMFSPSASANPHFAEMLRDIADLFELMAKRYEQ